MTEQDYFVVTYDKFIFRLPKGLLYSRDDTWVKVEGEIATVGVDDFLQRRSGDVAFAELEPVGTQLAPGDDLGNIETIKALLVVHSPVAGEIVEVNEELELRPELVNEDPYGAGWLVKVRLTDREADRRELMDAETFLPLFEQTIEEEGRRLK
jgi:glycine cleavage system H protein